MIYGLTLVNQIFSSNTKFEESELYVYIPTDSDYEAVKKIVAPYVEDIERFDAVANKKKYPNNVKPGKFLFKKGMNSNELINALRINNEVKLSFNNQERLEDFAGRIGSEIEADSVSLLNAIKDSTFLNENGFNEENVLTMFIPNTYELYWNTTAVKFRDKMIKEYRNFWNDERIAKAKAQGLTPTEATILASIVHKESVKKDERPRIAGVYLNRLHKGILLQADPTVIYAVKKQSNDFKQVIKRVLNKDLQVASPYNTYYSSGLPPGPIAMPDITAIEAVLNHSNFVDENPFLSPTLQIAPTNKKYDVFAGLKGKLADNISYNIRGSFVDENNKALFKSNDFIFNLSNQPYAFGNSLSIVYDNVKTVRFFGELKADITESISFGANGTISLYNTKIQEEAWNLPSIQLNANVDYAINSKWYAGADVFFVGSRKDMQINYDLAYIQIYPPVYLTTTTNLKSYIDLNAHVGYKHNERWTGFLKANNILNQAYQRWMNYPVQGFQVVLGANYKFDF